MSLKLRIMLYHGFSREAEYIVLKNSNPFQIEAVRLYTAPGRQYRALDGRVFSADDHGRLTLPGLDEDQTVILVADQLLGAEKPSYQRRGRLWRIDLRKAYRKILAGI